MAIELDRRFVECREEQQSDPDLIARYGRTDGTLSWPDLLTRRRVVFLAEAGSGKTTEMNARAHERAAAGHHAFYATVEDVGRQGLEATLRSADRAALAVWHSSDKEGWFFIDSVDEAKQSGLQLRAALRTVAEAIAGAERRAHRRRSIPTGSTSSSITRPISLTPPVAHHIKAAAWAGRRAI